MLHLTLVELRQSPPVAVAILVPPGAGTTEADLVVAQVLLPGGGPVGVCSGFGFSSGTEISCLTGRDLASSAGLTGSNKPASL